MGHLTQIALPEWGNAANLLLDRAERFTQMEYVQFCEANRGVKAELTVEGEIVIVPPAGGDSEYRSGEIFGQLREWARRSRNGKALGSSAGFILPDGSAMSPDAAWISNEALAQLTRSDRRQFLSLCPEFVVEVMSPSDRLPAAQGKMRNWIANGAKLGWLVDADDECVYVYRSDGKTDRVSGDLIKGEGPVKGFTLHLRDVWAGL